ncbi:8829_t:CDS:2, partial [Paraglomus brasilianum]
SLAVNLQQPFQAWQSQPWNYQQHKESAQQQQHHALNPAASTTDRAYYWDGSKCVYYQDLRPQSRQDQLPTNVFTFGVTGSIQQQNDSLSTLFTHRQPRQQQWLSQHPYSRQREVRTPNELFTPMQSEHQLDRQNSVQDILGVLPIEQSESTGLSTNG